jgi:CRP-like cAMP-binding protein
MPRKARQDLVDACDTVELPMGALLCSPGDVHRHVYFPTSGYISLITPPGASESLEVGLIGFEGAFGLTVLLDIRTSALVGLTQGSGTALRISAPTFLRRANADAGLRKVLHRYLYVLMAQLAQTAACSRFHQLDARLARWLLMTHDRARGASFYLTHQFLAQMLGVRRAGVTTAARRLQDDRFIAYRRGLIKVLDRKGLEAVACPCYRAVNDTYRRHLAAGR